MAQTIRLISAKMDAVQDKYSLYRMYACGYTLEFTAENSTSKYYKSAIVDSDGNYLNIGGINLTPREVGVPFNVTGYSLVIYQKRNMSYFFEFEDLDGTKQRAPLLTVTADQIEDGNDNPRVVNLVNNSFTEDYTFTIRSERMDSGAFNSIFNIDSIDFFEHSNREIPFHTQINARLDTSYIVPKTVRRTSTYAVVNIRDKLTGRKFINSFYSFSEIHPNKSGAVSKLADFKYLFDSTGTELNSFPRISSASPLTHLNFYYNLYTPIKRATSLAPDNMLDQFLYLYVDDKATYIANPKVTDNGSYLNRPANINTAIALADLRTGNKLFLKDAEKNLIKELNFVDTEYIVLPAESVKVKSMSPVDFNKPTWDYEFSPILPGISETEPYVVFENSLKSTSKKLGDRFYAEDLKGSIAPDSSFLDSRASGTTVGMEYLSLHIWYPNLGKMYLLRSTNGNGVGFYPLILTGKEKVTITKTGDVIAGRNIELDCDVEGFSEINAGKRSFQWYKDGVEIPGETTRALRINNLDENDTGNYTVKLTAQPSHPYAEDSLIIKNSEAINITVDTTRIITAKLTGEPMPIVLGQPFNLTGEITGGYGVTINYIRILKNSVPAKEFTVDTINPSLTIPVVDLLSSGIYSLVVGYTDNGVDLVAISEPVKAYFADDKPLNLSCVITGPGMVDEGQDVTFTAICTVDSDPTLTPVYTLHWYKDGIAVIDPTPDDLQLIIERAHYPEDEGFYYCTVSAHVPGYEPAIAESNKINLTILTDIELVARLYSDNAIINKGETTSIKIGFQANRPVNPTWHWHHKDGTLLQNGGAELIVSPIVTTTYYAIAYPGYGEGIQRPTLTNEFTIEVLEDPSDDGCDIYIHPLMPGRPGGFLWVGWWVIDEIEEAIADGFDWKIDPGNSRFKYPCSIKAIIKAMNDYGGVEAQESRNGYILKNEYFNR
ncbi:Hoc-like head decoration [Salmonella phage vB_SnwM_CGG4-1]|uniref:Ig-like domain-containing protein n=1 Tax=Salmonella phage vB_SnwM_CGG4-1 TaxID=1815631 RepID=A0A1B0VVM0_9CAUD|nr:Hoc-like head decoration [Salmonella phage vB_SnwM_CGG4-1]ANA49523.1 hypothetical protein CGG41_168 [Salmonella phage vB_SnwM_CGG4-1]